MGKLKQKLKDTRNTKYQQLFNELYTYSDIFKKSLLMLLIIFIIDYLNIFTKLIDRKEFILLYGIIVVLILIKIFEFKPWNLYKLQTVNYVDSFLISSIISLFCYDIAICIYSSGMSLKIIICSTIIIILSMLELNRVRKINKIKNKEIDTNVYDLKDLYDGNINKENNNLILIKEKEVDYDLLERGHIINKLYELVSNCYNGEKFVLALQGKWGSGKTTIINNLKKIIKKEKNIIVIDDFDPWSYEDEKAMFRGMFDSIMNKIGVNFSIKDISNFLRTYMNTIFNVAKYESTYNIIKKYYADYDKNNKLKKIINAYLKNNNKKILFIIDNIERADKDNIIFLFKLINNVLNFNNTIYLLCFDDERMKKIFEKDLNIDYEYLKKIIQLEIKIPKVHESVMYNIVNRCMRNLMSLYGMNPYEKECEKVIRLLASDITDLRELKIYLNSVISFNYKLNNYLNFQDTLLLELIKGNDIELYEEIWRNKQYFISEDTHMSSELYTLDTKGFNNKAKEYFDNLFSINNKKHKEYEEILSLMFPYVENYKKDRPIKAEYGSYMIGQNNNGDYKTNVKSKRIFSARYFDLYFSQCDNEFTNINKNIEEFIRIINSVDDMKVVEEKFIDLMNLYSNWIQKYTFETLEYYLSEINKDKKIVLLKIMYKHLKEYNNAMLFLGLSALQRIYIIMSEIIIEISQKEFEEFLKVIGNDYSKTYCIKELKYWMENNKNHLKEEYNQKLDRLNIVGKKLVEYIINNNIDILDEKYYIEKNLWGIYHETKEREQERKKYIKNILNKENIFRFLNDMLGRSVGSGYGYSVRKGNIEEFSSLDQVDNILKSIKRNLTEDEKLLLDIYEKSKTIPEDEHAIFLNEDKKFFV